MCETLWNAGYQGSTTKEVEWQYLQQAVKRLRFQLKRLGQNLTAIATGPKRPRHREQHRFLRFQNRQRKPAITSTFTPKPNLCQQSKSKEVDQSQRNPEAISITLNQAVASGSESSF
jgi:hypothetical protein